MWWSRQPVWSSDNPLIRELEAKEWFVNVGQPDPAYPLRAKSWPDAIARCASEEWRDFENELLNDVRLPIFRANRKRYNQWNNIVKSVNGVLLPLVARKIEAVKKLHRLPADLDTSVDWDIGGYYIEVAFADLIAPSHFTLLAECYAAGHFPCGWEGAYPAGGLIVY